MGEMGKVARGELPAEAIRPPPPKSINGQTGQAILDNTNINVNVVNTVNPASLNPDNEIEQMVKRKEDQENIVSYN